MFSGYFVCNGVDPLGLDDPVWPFEGDGGEGIEIPEDQGGGVLWGKETAVEYMTCLQFSINCGYPKKMK